MRSHCSLSLILGIIEMHLATFLFLRKLERLNVSENSASLLGLIDTDTDIDIDFYVET